MLGMTIIICIFLFFTIALILVHIDVKDRRNKPLIEICEDLNYKLQRLESEAKYTDGVIKEMGERLIKVEEKVKINKFEGF